MRLELLHPQFDFDRWSRAEGWLQRADPRAKALATLVLLAGVSLCAPQRYGGVAWLYGGGSALWAALTWSTGLPPWRLLRRAGLVLPFTVVYAAASWLAGEPLRAVSVSGKALLSAQFAVLLAASTPVENLLAGLERWHAPPFLLTIALLIYRYLFVIAGQAQRMRMAAAARAGSASSRMIAGALAVLFARSHQRAAGLHQAMLARGFRGAFLPLGPLRFTAGDALLVALAFPITAGMHWLGRL